MTLHITDVNCLKKTLKKFKMPKLDSKWNKKEESKSEVIYINAAKNKIAPNLDLDYAQFLAYFFTDGAPKA